MYKGEADWSLIAEVKNNPRMHIPVFGNGDINSPQKAVEYRNRYGVDGIMIGRASIGAPGVFREMKHDMATGELLSPPGMTERVAAAQDGDAGAPVVRDVVVLDHAAPVVAHEHADPLCLMYLRARARRQAHARLHVGARADAAPARPWPALP